MRLAITFFLLALTLCPVAGFAQGNAPSWQWATGPSIPPTALQTDALGNTYTGGYLTTPLRLSAGIVLTSQAGEDGFIAKYSPSGAFLWSCQLAGPGDERITKLVVDPAGGVYLLGYFASTVQLESLSLTASAGSGNQATFLAHVDATGHAQWIRQPNTGRSAPGTDLGVDATGNLYLTGILYGSTSFGGLSLSVPAPIAAGAYYDRYLVKFDTQGGVLWARQGGRVLLPNNVPFYHHQLLVSPAGDAYLSIQANALATGPYDTVSLPANAGDFDAAIVKYNTQGTAQWAQQGGGPARDQIIETALDEKGHVAFACQFPSTATFGTQVLTSAGSQTGALVVLDASTGAVQWARAFTSTGPSTARLSGVTADPQGNWYVAGAFTNTAMLGGRTVVSAGGLDLAVASFSPQGDLNWLQQAGGLNDEAAFFLSRSGSGSLVIGGVYTGTTQLGSYRLTAQGGATAAEGFVAQLAGTSLALQAPQIAAPLFLYPNPASTTEMLTLPVLPIGTILSLQNALGQTVRTSWTAEGLALNGLVTGVYYVQAAAPSGQRWTGKLQIE